MCIRDSNITWDEGIVGANAIEKVGNPYPDETHDKCLNSDAVLFGAIGDPKFDNDPSLKIRPEQGLLSMRKKLGLYANIRPTFTFEELIDKSPLKKELIQGTDIVFVRELTSGIYFGERGRSDDKNSAFDTCYYRRDEIERLAKIGFNLSMKRKKKLCCVDKANVLESSRLWRETIQAMAGDRLWIYTAIAGSLFGAAFLAYFQGTRIGLWAYSWFDRILDYLIQRWGWTWLQQPEDALSLIHI